LLLDAGADVDAATDDGDTSLKVASHNGHIEVVKLLLDAGAKMKLMEHDSPLRLALKGGHTEVANLLADAIAEQDPILSRLFSSPDARRKAVIEQYGGLKTESDIFREKMSSFL
jgi:ankyrin repeat protein